MQWGRGEIHPPAHPTPLTRTSNRLYMYCTCTHTYIIHNHTHTLAKRGKGGEAVDTAMPHPSIHPTTDPTPSHLLCPPPHSRLCVIGRSGVTVVFPARRGGGRRKADEHSECRCRAVDANGLGPGDGAGGWGDRAGRGPGASVDPSCFFLLLKILKGGE